MPVANGFLRQEDFGTEKFQDLEAGFCEPCSMMQLINPVRAETLFHDRYPFSTSSSRLMSEHFRRLAENVLEGLSYRHDPFVVEVGSNDGTTLLPFVSAGIRHLGVDPSKNVAEMASGKGVSTLCAFFDAQTAKAIALEYGQADVILACNCFCHISDLGSLAEGLQTILKPDGVLIFEDPYVGDILRLNAYDQIYDEHVFYFSLTAVTRWLVRFGLEVVNAQPQAVHGGSMRYTVARRGIRPVSPVVSAICASESQSGLHRQETFDAFRIRVEHSRDALVQLLGALRVAGKRVVGYGATSKSTTVLNYCGITSAMIEFICDTTPLKHGTFTPGTHIPVRPHIEFAAGYPDYALLFAWNHSAEIMAKEAAFLETGGQWIRYVPEVAIL